MQDLVVLVDEQNKVIGVAEKLSTHNANTPLHRGISLFLFDKKENLLLQQRSHKKKTWPLVWSNSCCGHPGINETSMATAKRRLKFELGISDAKIKVILPDYRYRFERSGIFENEFCPVMVGVTGKEAKINPNEVEQAKWIHWTDWLSEVKNNPQNYSEWCVEETKLLSENKEFLLFFDQLGDWGMLC
jgi:isopentenyl-diphosphate delta-isomerase